MKPKFVTFSGVDDRTNINRMDDIARRYASNGESLVEWGFLFSKTNKDARYPCNQAVDEMLDTNGRKSVHMCGQNARDAVSLNLSDEIRAKLWRFNRMQINGFYDYNTASDLCSIYNMDVIFQSKSSNAYPDDQRFYYLFDASGGTGKFPQQVPSVHTKIAGYAGGIGPDTVTEYLSLITQANSTEVDFWIDMEQRVRTNGWLDLDKVERVLEIVYR